MSHRDIEVGDYILFGKKQEQIGRVESVSLKEFIVVPIVLLESLQQKVERPFFRELVQKTSTKKLEPKSYVKVKVIKLFEYLNNYYDLELQRVDEEKVLQDEVWLLRFYLLGKTLKDNSNPKTVCQFCHQLVENGDIFKCSCNRYHHESCRKKNCTEKCRECNQSSFIHLGKKQNSIEEFNFGDFNKKENLKQFEDQHSSKKLVIVEKSSSAQPEK